MVNALSKVNMTWYMFVAIQVTKEEQKNDPLEEDWVAWGTKVVEMIEIVGTRHSSTKAVNPRN